MKKPTIFDIAITKPLSDAEIQTLEDAYKEVNKYSDKLHGLISDAYQQQSLALFPIGTRVVMTGDCPCSKRHKDKTGRIREAVTAGAVRHEYRVVFDAWPSDYEFICDKGMKRLEEPAIGNFPDDAFAPKKKRK